MDWIYLAQYKNKWRGLWPRWWASESLKMRGISWLAEELLSSQDGMSSVEWVSYRVWMLWYSKCPTYKLSCLMKEWGSFVQSSCPLTSVGEGEVVVVNMRVCGEEEVLCHVFLTSALGGSDGQPHSPAALPTGRETPFRIQRKLFGLHSRLDLFWKLNLLLLAGIEIRFSIFAYPLA
jgi:hypothetical protein